MANNRRQSRMSFVVRSSPSKRSVIPAFRYFYFKGVIEYLNILVTRIDTPHPLTLRHANNFLPSDRF